MRFNKKRGWALFGRPSPDVEASGAPEFTDTNEQPEYNEDVEPEMEEDIMAVPGEDTVQVSGDPIQNLFSTLGKFNRHLSQAQHAPDSPEWAEKCMDELASGLEIAMTANWTPVKDALIDTARILHSFDSAGRRRECIPFLNSSYEILSLMVGDLIVDKVRSGVIQKWKDLYGNTLTVMNKAGITLIEDEEAQERYHQEEEESSPDESTSEYEEETPQGEDTLEEDLLPDTDSLPTPPNNHANIPRGKAQDIHNETEYPFDLPPLSEPDSDEQTEAETTTDTILEFPAKRRGKMAAVQSSDTMELPTEEELLSEQSEGRALETESQDAPAKDEKSSSGEDLFTDLATETPDLHQEKPSEEFPSNTSENDFFVSEDDLDSPIDEDASTEDEEEPSFPEPQKTETSKASTSSVDPESQHSQSTLDLDLPADAGSPAHLLRQAEEAMNKGDVRSAKTMALELALAMARIEYEQARAEEANAEQQLIDNAQAIETAQGKVEEAERELLRTEELLATRDGESSACRDYLALIDEELEQYQAELSEIDAQIEALQRKRAEQVNRIENKHADREASIDNESRLQTEMESLRQEVDTIRQQLESHQNAKKKLLKDRSDIETSICMAREESEGRRLSLDAIERTRSAVPENCGPCEDEEQLL